MQKTVQEVQQVEQSEIQDEAMQSSVKVEGGDGVEAPGLQSTLDDVADGFDVTGFKCPTCGLAHMHDTNKHRANDSFDMSVDDAAGMDYNPNCHCAVNELARHGSDYGVDEDEAARIAQSAPIPDETTQEMNSKYGGV